MNSPAVTPALPTKSIRSWVKCGGVEDSASGVAAAFAAAKNNSFILQIDCPVLIRIGTDVAKTIFVDSNTSVQFTGTGLFIIDNIFTPAFAIVNSNNINFTNWRVQYSVDSIPVEPETGSYLLNGVAIQQSGITAPSLGFNSKPLKQWLINNRGLSFNMANPYWTGPVDIAAVFYMQGSTSQVSISGLKLFVPPTAGGHQFVPTAVSFNMGPKNNTVITATTPIDSTYYAIPTNITFTDIDLDGTYMGWQGNVQNLKITTVRSHRYGDLQDASGNNVGGVGKWFAPPHLFYINYAYQGHPAFYNKNIEITDVIDYGVRVGVARDKGGNDSVSGHANSLKIGGINVVVDNYKSYRPDGFVSVLPGESITIQNIEATYNSNFLNNLFPAIQFPSDGYKNLTLKNIKIEDLASRITITPIGPSFPDSNDKFILSNIQFTLNKWGDADYNRLFSTGSAFGGTNHAISLQYIANSATGYNPQNISTGMSGSMRWQLVASPAIVKSQQSATLYWNASNASTCSSDAMWNTGQVTGSQLVTSPTAGIVNYGLSCSSSSGVAMSTSVPINYQAQ